MHISYGKLYTHIAIYIVATTACMHGRYIGRAIAS